MHVGTLNCLQIGSISHWVFQISGSACNLTKRKREIYINVSSVCQLCMLPTCKLIMLLLIMRILDTYRVSLICSWHYKHHEINIHIYMHSFIMQLYYLWYTISTDLLVQQSSCNCAYLYILHSLISNRISNRSESGKLF